MFGRGKGLFWGKGRGKNCNKHRRRCRHTGQKFPLSNAETGSRHFIVLNPDKKTLEMGIYNGCVITIHKNEPADKNIVVGVGDSRYIIPRTTAEHILVE
jgi:Fe2+ transport system protein FeoA